MHFLGGWPVIVNTLFSNSEKNSESRVCARLGFLQTTAKSLQQPANFVIKSAYEHERKIFGCVAGF